MEEDGLVGVRQAELQPPPHSFTKSVQRLCVFLSPHAPTARASQGYKRLGKARVIWAKLGSEVEAA